MTRFDLLEADLARYYHLDLPEALWGPEPVSARRLSAFVRALPVDAATVRAVVPTAGWGHQEELLATLVELTDARWHWFYDVHARPGSRRPTPVRVQRPGQANGDDVGARPTSEVVAYLARFRPPREVSEDGTRA